MDVRKALHLGPRKTERPADPHHPHEFRAAGENWLDGGVSPAGLSNRDSNAGAMAAVGMRFADRHCIVCRRESTDPIHAPAEE
jgi:hypothetical protein